jgi:hypothetical protein
MLARWGCLDALTAFCKHSKQAASKPQKIPPVTTDPEAVVQALCALADQAQAGHLSRSWYLCGEKVGMGQAATHFICPRASRVLEMNVDMEQG